jgi:hypothetical protein
MRQQRTGLLVIAMMFMMVLARVFGGGPAHAADPDFTHVTDILDGWRQLLRTDDLFLIRSAAPDGASGSRLLTSNSHITSITPTQRIPGGEGSATVIGARMFDLPTDVAVSAWDDPGTRTLHWSIDGSQGNLTSGTISIAGIAGSDFQMMSDSADFTGDGYDDVIFVLPGRSIQSPLPDTVAVVATARDPADPSKGLAFGSAAILPFGGDHIWPRSITTGTVAGTLRVLALGTHGSVRSSCNRNNLAVESYTVDPQSLAISGSGTFALTLQEPAGFCIQSESITAGRFGTTAHDQVVVAYAASDEARIIPVAFDDKGTPTQRPTFHTGVNAGYGKLRLRSGRFNWNSAFEQAALLIFPEGQGLPAPSLRILDFDQNLNVQSGPAAGSQGCSLDLEVGNFDRRKSNSTERDPNLQLAVLFWNCSGGTATVQIYDVDPTQGFRLVAGSVSDVGPASGINRGFSLFDGTRSLATVDLQGRSLVLGAPIKVTVTGHLQPDLILGIPPMHIDYIRDVANLGPTGKPAVLNLTVMPDVLEGTSFNTQFAFSSTASSSLSTNNTTSWGYSQGESLGLKVTLGNPDASYFSDEVKVAGKETHETSVADTYDTYESVTDSLSATTGFADHLFFTESRHNVYYYPVIGQEACPAGNPSCTDAQKGPLFVQFSGVDLLEHHATDATTQEWYQPVNEPGNLFSYPWSLAQLQRSIPNLAPLTANPAPWRATDTSTSAYSTTWTGRGTGAHTTGHVDTHSFDLSIAVTAQVGAEGIATAGLSGEYDYGTSDSASDVFTSTGSMEKSTGIQVNKPDFGDKVARTYFYEFAGYVLGRQRPDTIFDSKTVYSNGDDKEPVEIQSVGPVAVAFLANPVGKSGAPWWRKAYKEPDVGLSHPARWSWSPSLQEASFNSRSPKQPPQNDPFYHMKGLFISQADGKGPQRSIATAGDTVLLQARVYNFSLADMAPTTTIHVRFYGQEYENAELVGDGFLIGETSIGPIPGFNSATTQGERPNWSLASLPFDTSAYADKHLVFWVLVWAEDGQGNLMPELEGHGLTANPRSSSFTQITQVPTEDYSNNVGLYGTYTPFFVAPKQQALAEARAAPGQLVLAGIKVAADHVLLLEHGNTVTVTVQNTAGTPLAAVPVVFYDGDPQQGGKVFDVQHIPRLRAHASYALRTFFRPTTCGDHRLFVRAGHTTASSDTAALDVQVTIDPDAYIDALIGKTTTLGLPRRVEGPLVNELDAAKGTLDRQLFEEARDRLTAFVGEVEAQRGGLLTDRQVESLIVPARLIPSCVAL